MINRDTWLAALDEVCAIDNDPAVVSMREFADLIGLKRSAAQMRMELLLQAGKATKTVKRVRRSNGQVVTLPGYRLVTDGAHDQAQDA